MTQYGNSELKNIRKRKTCKTYKSILNILNKNKALLFKTCILSKYGPTIVYKSSNGNVQKWF